MDLHRIAASRSASYGGRLGITGGFRRTFGVSQEYMTTVFGWGCHQCDAQFWVGPFAIMPHATDVSGHQELQKSLRLKWRVVYQIFHFSRL